MRVLVVTNMYPTPEEPWFGCFVKEQIDAICDRGVAVEVFHFDGRAQRRRYIFAMREVRRKVQADSFDLIHAHYGLVGLVAMTQRRLPVITTFHGSDGYVRWQRYVSCVVARCTTPIFVATETARCLRIDEPLVAPCSIDMSLFKPVAKAQAKRELGWAEDQRYVLFPGARNNRGKRADLFDAAVRLVKRSAPDIEPRSLEGIARDQVPVVMNAVDVLLMTSDWEGSPLAVKEALACRTPVVSVSVGDVPEVLAGLPGCSIADRKPRELAEATLRALASGRSPDLRERAKVYSHDRMADRIVEIYRDVVARNP